MSVTQRTVTVSGMAVEEFTMRNEKGNMVLTMVSYGASITSCEMGAESTSKEEVTLCYPLERLIEEPGPYFGATVGRVANRICDGKFTLPTDEDSSVAYTLATNNGSNHLHGGLVGFDKKNWDHEVVNSSTHVGVKFRCTSEDMEEGYPGTVRVEATYEISRTSCALAITFRAYTDKVTPINLTNHTYWNLSGNLIRDVKDHTLLLNCDRYLPVSASQIPTGELASVTETSFDFTNKKIQPQQGINLPVPPVQNQTEFSCHDPSTEGGDTDNSLPELSSEEIATETDAEFIARMEREEAVAFAAAVQSWREERASGGGQAIIVESGGDFVSQREWHRTEEKCLVEVPRKLREALADVNGGGQPGLDHCFLVNGYDHRAFDVAGSHGEKGDEESLNLQLNDQLRVAAVLCDPTSGRSLECRTTQPGLQVYTANWLPPCEDKRDGELGSSSHSFTQHNAICLEAQGLPDAVNHGHFPSTLLHPANVYSHKSVYTFMVEERLP